MLTSHNIAVFILIFNHSYLLDHHFILLDLLLHLSLYWNKLNVTPNNTSITGWIMIIFLKAVFSISNRKKHLFILQTTHSTSINRWIQSKCETAVIIWYVILNYVYAQSQYHFGSDVTSASFAFNWSRGREQAQCGDTLSAYTQNKRWFYRTSLPNC